jgi:hypothetical protein
MSIKQYIIFGTIVGLTGNLYDVFNKTFDYVRDISIFVLIILLSILIGVVRNSTKQNKS